MKDLLIIDEEKWSYEAFLDLFDDLKISYDFCESGAEALEKLHVSDYKAILLDIRVTLGEAPDYIAAAYSAPGIYLLEKIREIKPKIIVLAWTVVSEKNVIKNLKDRGAEYFSKGADSDAFIDRIKGICKK